MSVFDLFSEKKPEMANNTNSKPVDPPIEIPKFKEKIDEFNAYCNKQLPITSPGSSLNSKVAEFTVKKFELEKAYTELKEDIQALDKEFPSNKGWAYHPTQTSLNYSIQRGMNAEASLSTTVGSNVNGKISTKEGAEIGGGMSASHTLGLKVGSNVENTTGAQFDSRFSFPDGVKDAQKKDFITKTLNIENKMQNTAKLINSVENTDLWIGHENAKFVLKNYKELAKQGLVEPGDRSFWSGDIFDTDSGSWLEINGREMKPLVGKEYAIKDKEHLLKLNFDDPNLDLRQFKFEDAKGINTIHKDGLLMLEKGGKPIKLYEVADSKIRITQNAKEVGDTKLVQTSNGAQTPQSKLDENLQSTERTQVAMTDDEKLEQIPGLSFNDKNVVKGPGNDGGPDFC